MIRTGKSYDDYIMMMNGISVQMTKQRLTWSGAWLDSATRFG
jgi:hypothetical protein